MSAASGIRRVVRLRDLHRSYRAGTPGCWAEVAALESASAEIRGGEILLVCGPAGAGKTTLLLCAAGLLRCDSGLIERGMTVAYRDLSAGSDAKVCWPAKAAILLDSLERAPEAVKDRIVPEIATALSRQCAIVIGSREPQLAMSLVPPMATLSVVHLRL